MMSNLKTRFESPNSSLRRSSSLPSCINLYCHPNSTTTNNIQQNGQPLLPPFTTHHSPPTLSSQYLEQYNNNHQHLSIFNNQSSDNSRPFLTNSSTPTSFCQQQQTNDFTAMQDSNIQDFSKIAPTNDMMICQSDNFPQQQQDCDLGYEGDTTSINHTIPSHHHQNHNSLLPNNNLNLTMTPNFQSFDQFLKENSYKYHSTSSVNGSHLVEDDTKRKRMLSIEDKEEEREHHQIKMTRSGTSTSCAFNMF